MALITVATNSGNRFSTRYQEISIICQLQECLTLRVTSRTGLLVPSLGSPPGVGTSQPTEIAWVEVDRLLDSCWLSSWRELIWGYWGANRPTPAPPQQIISCQFTPLKVDCSLIPFPFAPELGLAKVNYSYKLIVTYQDGQGVTARAEVTSGPLAITYLVRTGPGASCHADLQVFILNTQIVSGNPPLHSSPLALSPTAALLLREVVTRQWDLK